ncbi:MAG: hypothetical protein SGJ15_04645 [Bacteroidota bacterium]|nr:hypothetical protein [Bacteroidota bacterium]
MKTQSRLFCFLIVLLLNDKSNAQGVDEGDEIITPYYGPSLFKGLYNHYSPSYSGAAATYKTNDIGTFGISSEYLVNDVIGLGIDLYYNKTETSWTQVVEKYDPNSGLTQLNTYSYKITAPTFAALGRVNFHYSSAFSMLSMLSDEFDSYIIVAFGYKKTNYKVVTTDPDYVFDPRRSLFSLFTPSNPIGGKLGAGFRYFFTDEAGINIEVMAGQPFIAGGISFRF